MSRSNNRIDEDPTVADLSALSERRLLMLQPTDDAVLSPAPESVNGNGVAEPTNGSHTVVTGPQSPKEPTLSPDNPKLSTGGPKFSTSARRKQQFHNMTSKISIIPNNRQGQLNTAFLATLPGVLKVGEIILCFIAFLLAISSDRRATSAAWTDHISFECMIVVTALLLGYVVFPHLTLNNEPTREGLIVVELLFYGINTLFFFIGVFLMVHLSASWTAEGRGAAILSAVVSIGLTLLFAIETFLKLNAWRGENEPQTRITQNNSISA